MKCNILISFLLLIIPFLGYAQSNTLKNLGSTLDELKNEKPKTSVYIRTNKGIYETGEDLWFKSYILDDTYLEPSSLDSILYVQLSHIKKDSVVWEQKYRIKNGFSDGHIFLDTKLKSGNYYLKAYTKHSFTDASGPMHSVRRIGIVDNIQSEYKKIRAQSNTNSDSIKKPILGFFPEGGHLVNGLESTVAFKITDTKGQPINTSGTLFENNKPLTTFKTAYFGLGMGSFRFVPDSSKHYYFKLDGQSQDYKLPKILSKGITLQKLITLDTSKVSFRIRGNIGLSRIYMRAQSRGKTMAMASAILTDSVNITIPVKDFPAGICEFTLFDNELQPIAERLMFLNCYKKLYISTELSKETFKTREKVTFKIKTTNELGQPAQANLVLSVFDKAYGDLSDSKNIMTHYGLSTQLKGSIHNPANYFNEKNKKRDLGLDLLMLVNGWRQYVWNTHYLKQEKHDYLLNQGIYGKVKTITKNKNGIEQSMVATVGPSGKGNNDFHLLDDDKSFQLGPEVLKKGNHFYIKNFGDNNHKVAVYVTDGFDIINRVANNEVSYPSYYVSDEEKDDIRSFKTNETEQLDEIIIQGKKANVFRDKYLGRLDSLAKLNINDDYVGKCGILNCPVHLHNSGNTLPVEGEEYKKHINFRWYPDGSRYTADGYEYIIYKYPEFTKEEILEKFNLLKVKGFYGEREFYQPDYDEFNDPNPDYRNTLFWKPNILTDENGEATISFYCSDIKSTYIGLIEGVGNFGKLGQHNFSFAVNRE